MRAPEFWYRTEPGWQSTVLAPAAAFYDAGRRLRRAWSRPQELPIPVVCVGNLVAGGAGKTPVALAVIERLAARGRAAFAVSRGYGGSERGPLEVDTDIHNAGHVGDEPLLLAARTRTWVARNRAAGLRVAAAAGAQVAVLDDGFQNPTLPKDLALLVVDGAAGIGNGRLLPAGPLREPAAEGLARADALVLLGGDGGLPHGLVPPPGLPVLRARLQPVAGSEDLAGRAVVAFAGIGRPEKAFATLIDLGARLVAAVPFPDHHRYAADEIMRLVETAVAEGAELVTTEKDWVRLPLEARPMVRMLPVKAVFDDEAALAALLDRVGPRGR